MHSLQIAGRSVLVEDVIDDWELRQPDILQLLEIGPAGVKAGRGIKKRRAAVDDGDHAVSILVRRPRRPLQEA